MQRNEKSKISILRIMKENNEDERDFDENNSLIDEDD